MARSFDATLSGPSPPAAYAAADFNADGKTDLVIGATNGLVELFGNGNGTFQTPITFPAESKSNIAAVALADIDGDGKQDVVTTSDSQAGVSYFKGDGSGGFTPTRSYLPASVSGGGRRL